MIVADTNLLMYLTVEKGSESLCAQADAVFKKDPQWLLPGLWRHEYLNALSVLLRSGVLTEEECINTWYKALGFFSGQDRPFEQTRALQMTRQYGVTGYDAQFLALAETYQVFLVTEDKKLRKAAPLLTKSMAEVLA